MVPVDKDGNELAQSQYGLVGFRQSLQLAYNANGELEKSIKIHQQGFEVTTTTTNYFYDAFGRRVAKSSELQKASKINQRGKLVRFPDSLLHLRVDEKANRQTMLMSWDGNRQVQEYTTDHVFTTVYEQDSFVPVARVVWLQPHLQEQAKIAEDKQWQELEHYVIPKYQKQRLAHQSQTGVRIYYYHNDHLGTPQELTNSLGEVVWLNYSQAWGGSYETKCFAKELDSLDVSADLLQPIRFQGQFFDGETNLHYNRFRYYDSDVGMFVSRDPIELEGGLNTFTYVPNPTSWIDPSGLQNQRITKCKCNDECPAGTMNPDKIHFMQSSAKNQTGDYTVIDNANALSNGTLQPEILKIKIWKDNNDKIWTLDHRRLAAFKIAKKCAPYEWASQKEIDSQMWKMTTKTGGQTMKLKLGDGKSIIVR